MTQDEIMDLARQAGLLDEVNGWDVWFPDELEAFAKLVAAAERKACAKVCDDRAFQFFSESPFFVEMHGLADAIRARGEA
jgi:hypothetical protein